MMASASWDGHDHHMATGPEDEFHHFLDMSGMPDSMQFDFNSFQDGATAQAMMNRQRDTPDAIMNDSGAPDIMSQATGMMHNQPPPINTSVPHSSGPTAMIPTSAPASDPISSIDAQIQYLQQQKFHQQQRQLQDQRTAFFQNQSVPPTPQSLEMPPNSGHFYTQPEQMSHDVYDAGYHHQQRMKEQGDMAFTPLVSPAVTPLDPHYIENNFTAYFSPLTSPALHAQNDNSSVYDPSTQSNNSPVEMELETTQPPVAATMELSKKARKNNAAKARSKAGGVKSSPITKPQRRKTGPSPAIVSQVLSEVEERTQQQVVETMLPLPANSTEGSEENASVSPENLTEMPPPPVPARRSTSKSPYIQAQNTSTPSPMPSAGSSTPTSRPSSTHAQPSAEHPHPATPASLMRLPASKNKKAVTSHPDQTATDNIETLELPESVAKKQFAPINTQLAPKDTSYQDPGSAKGAGFQPLPSPVFARPGTGSANQSPLLQPGSTGPAPRKTPTLASRASRKGSVQVSPALLPRISPNIKPLLPGTPGESAEDTASRLLMSKSNYQNILEGNTVPGVSYPTELSTNLTSKRTSHKIAEQGRRNRINSALQIMAGLLPDQPKAGSGEDSDKKDSKQAHAANSKASVVEKAIVHLQNLTKENVEMKEELKDLRDKLEQLKSSQ